ncbi:sentrin-specific protease 8-like [Planococcus citri]|uniref:sentrin-specific protease 8-like n=1 Tax=Planococcus citri TaxID=170843 RepID=UPI0031F883A6
MNGADDKKRNTETDELKDRNASMDVSSSVERQNNGKIFHHQTPPKSEEPIVLDLTVSDEYGNRTLPIYRRSVRLKFDENETPTNDSQYSGYSCYADDMNYLSSLEMPELMYQAVDWKLNMLDDDVITTVINVLQSFYSDMLFINPCITQCILFAKVKHVPLFLDPLAAKSYRYVFFVLNDSRRCDHSSHWSLAVLDTKSEHLYHFDSMRNTNYKVAYELAQKICEYFDAWQMTDVYSEQQGNTTDCGYFVIDNILKLIHLVKMDMNLTRIVMLPSMISKTKNFIQNLYLRSKTGTAE